MQTDLFYEKHIFIPFIIVTRPSINTLLPFLL